MGIVTNKLNGYLKTVENFDDLLNRLNDGISPKSEIYTHKNQLLCAINCLKSYDSNYPRPNYVCIKSNWPQMGKTGVLIAILKLISILNLENTMGIRDVYYITGDNSTGLIEQSKERLKSCIEKINPEFHLHLLKNSDMKADLANVFIMERVFIFIDESHFGTSSESNILIKWLKSKGLDMHNNKNLVDKNVYIISNSATLFKEEISDIGGWKSYVILEPGDDYVGFEEFYNEGCIVGIKVPLNKLNVEEYCIDFTERLNENERETGKKKCAMVRLSSVKKYNQLEPVLKAYFHLEPFFTAKRDIDYYKMWWLAEHSCDEWDKPLMIVIIGACRMGDTIPLQAKRNIGIYYDCAGNGKNSVMATIQGLPGRAAGYWVGEAKDEWRDISIFINDNHRIALIENKINKSSKTPLYEKIEECFIPSEDGKKLKLVPDNGFIEIKTDRKFDGKTYNKEIEEFLNGPDGFSSIGKTIPESAIWIPGRRNSTNIQSHFDIPEFMAHYGDRIRKLESDPENEGKICYTSVYDYDEGIIKVRFATFLRGDYVTNFIETTKITKTLTTDIR